MASGEYENAIQDFNKVIEIYPEHEWAYNNRGLFYLALKEYDKAIQDFNKVLTLNPEHSEAYEKRSEAYSKILDKNLL